MRLLLPPLLVAAMLLSGCSLRSGRAECKLHGGDTWHEITTPHFRVRTNLKPTAASDYARHIERIRQAHLNFFAGPDFEAKGRIDVIALRGFDEVKEFRPKALGFATQIDLRPLIVTTGTRPERGSSVGYYVLAHEIAHAVSGKVIPRQPKWLAEGLAEFLESTRVHPDGLALIGRPGEDQIGWAQTTGLLPMREVFAWQYSENEDPERKTKLYTSSWLLVHYLCMEHLERFQKFWVHLGSATDPDALWSEHFPELEPEVLDKRLRAYRNTRLRSYVYQLRPPPPVSFSVREMTHAEVHLARVDAFGGAGSFRNPMGRAARDLEQAIALDPHHPHARRLEVGLERDPKLRLHLAEELVRDHPRDAEAWVAWAAALAVGKVDQRREALARALTLDPDHPYAHYLYSHAFIGESMPQRSLEHAQISQRLAPGFIGSADLIWRAKFALGRCEEVESDLSYALNLGGTPYAALKQNVAERVAGCRRVRDERLAAEPAP